MFWMIAAALFFSAGAVLGADEGVLGVWLTEGGDSKVELYQCGEKICGRVVWLKLPNYRDSSTGPVGEPKIDFKNPDPKLRSRPIIGLQVIEGLTPKGQNRWDHGTCYDPESGNTYHCKMKLRSPHQIDLRGYIGISLIGRTFMLSR